MITGWWAFVVDGLMIWTAWILISRLAQTPDDTGD